MTIFRQCYIVLNNKFRYPCNFCLSFALNDQLAVFLLINKKNKRKRGELKDDLYIFSRNGSQSEHVIFVSIC